MGLRKRRESFLFWAEEKHKSFESFWGAVAAAAAGAGRVMERADCLGRRPGGQTHTNWLDLVSIWTLGFGGSQWGQREREREREREKREKDAQTLTLLPCCCFQEACIGGGG
jgi:hypothetical protein